MNLRPGTSDASVWQQVYAEGQYIPLRDLTPAVVVDLGAYTGISTCWFAETWPDAWIIAVEPDPGNYAELVRNVARFNGRVWTCPWAVWSRPTRHLALDPATAGEGREWSRRYHEHPDGTTIGVTVDMLTSERIGLLKCDIEGAEAEVFAGAPWLDRVDAIVIELHERYAPGVTDLFMRAIAGDFDVVYSGELTICRRK